jgi:hypothetical protein
MSDKVKKITSFRRQPAPTPASKPAVVGVGDMTPDNLDKLMEFSQKQKEIEKLKRQDDGPAGNPTPFEQAYADIQAGRKTIDDLSEIHRNMYLKAVNELNQTQNELLQEATKQRLKNAPESEIKVTPIESLPTDKQEEIRRTIRNMMAMTNEPRQPEAMPAATEKPVTEAERTPEVVEPEVADEPESDKFCQRCGWNHNYKFPDYYSPEDKSVYVQTFLGGRRFVKQYVFMGDKARITFRSLTPREESAAVRQMAIEAVRDDRDGILQDSDRYVQSLSTYRALMSIESIEMQTPNGKSITELPPFFEIEVDKDPEKSRLEVFSESAIDILFPTTEHQTIAYQLFQEFDRTLQALRVASQRPDF